MPLECSVEYIRRLRSRWNENGQRRKAARKVTDDLGCLGKHYRESCASYRQRTDHVNGTLIANISTFCPVSLPCFSFLPVSLAFRVNRGLRLFIGSCCRLVIAVLMCLFHIPGRLRDFSSLQRQWRGSTCRAGTVPCR